MLYSLFWVIPPASELYGRFGTLCSIFMGGVNRKKSRMSIWDRHSIWHSGKRCRI